MLGLLQAAGETIDATLTWLDESTGRQVSARWIEIDPHTRDQIVHPSVTME